jgi:sugar phosphate isomerase/epimerase
MVYLAARAGYDFVGLRLIPMGVAGENPCVSEDRGILKKTRKALEETGIGLLDLELARILRDKSPKEYEPAMEAAAELGARHVISSAWEMTEPIEKDRVIERYAEICDLASPFGLTVELEFPTFSKITDLKEAVEIVTAAHRNNSGILLDTLYIHFSKIGLDELAALPDTWLHFIHVCDTVDLGPGTREEMIHTARADRRYMGEGVIDFKPVLDILPAVPLAIELPNAQRVKQLGYEGHARRCLDTARNYLDFLYGGNDMRSVVG